MKKFSYIIISLLFLISVSLLIFVPRLQEESYRNIINPDDVAKLEPRDRVQLQKDFALVENSFRTTLAQIIGGSLLLFSLYLTYRNVKIAQDNLGIANENVKLANENLRVTEEGKLTDRFSKAVELLGDEKLEVRLGGIYALERIAQDSQKDHWTVMEVLTAFVRENSPIVSEKKTTSEKDLAESSDNEKGKSKGKLPHDIQAIMTVIGRRKYLDSPSQYGLALFGVSLIKVNLYKANLNESYLHRSNLSEAYLVGADLSRAHLQYANLNQADISYGILKKTELTKAILSSCNLNSTDLSGADLSEADISKADLNNAVLKKTNIRKTKLTSVKNLTLNQLLSATNYKEAILPAELARELAENLDKEGTATNRKVPKG